MKSKMLSKKIVISLAASGLLFLAPLGVSAEEAAHPQEGSGGQMGAPHMMGEHHKSGKMVGMRQHHEQMEKMHKAMMEELQKQMSALRKHAKAMEGISDEKQLLTEMKKHQQMTDDLLGTMLEQHQKMHARMQKHHEEMHGQMEKNPPSEGSGTE